MKSIDSAREEVFAEIVISIDGNLSDEESSTLCDAVFAVFSDKTIDTDRLLTRGDIPIQLEETIVALFLGHYVTYLQDMIEEGSIILKPEAMTELGTRGLIIANSILAATRELDNISREGIKLATKITERSKR